MGVKLRSVSLWPLPAAPPQAVCAAGAMTGASGPLLRAPHALLALEAGWVGACSAGALLLGLAIWLRVQPPWRLARAAGSPAVRRAAWDALRSRLEERARSSRRPLRVLLIRHGQSMANTAFHIVGGRDVRSELSALGEEQARLVGERLKREGLFIGRVYSSHAVRARRTAEIACRAMGFAAGVLEEPRLVEFSQGGLEKQLREEVYRPEGPVMRGILREGNLFFRPPGYSPDGDRGESQWDTEVRFGSFVDQLLEEGSPPCDGAVAIFSHGIAIRSFVRGIIGASSTFVVCSETANTSITELEYVPDVPGEMGGWRLIRLNDSAHLAQLEA